MNATVPPPADPPLVEVAPWDETSCALVLRPGSDARELAQAVAELPSGARFVEAFGDLDATLVYSTGTEPTGDRSPDPHAVDATPLPAPAAAGDNGAHPLAAIRAAYGWTYQDLADVLARRARRAGVNLAANRQKVWRWEHRGVAPDRLTQRCLAAELGLPFALLTAHPWPTWLPAARTTFRLPSIASALLAQAG